MSRMLITLAFVAWWNHAFAQVPETEEGSSLTTKLDAFFEEVGGVSVKEYFEIGRLDYTCIVQAIVAYKKSDPSERVRGLKIDVRELSTSRERGTPKSGFVDFDDIDKFIELIGDLLVVANEWKDTPVEHREARISLPSGIELGFMQENQKQTFFVTCGLSFANTSQQSDIQKIEDFLQIVTQGREFLRTR